MRYCAVENCSNSDLNALCHRFPKNRQNAQKWQNALNLDHVSLDILMAKQTICYMHFNASDYRNAASNSLNTNAMPQLHPTNPREYGAKSFKQTLQEQMVKTPENVSDSIELLHEDTEDATETEDNLIGTPLGSDDICILPDEQNAADALLQSIDGAGFTMLDAASCAFMNDSKTFEVTDYSKDLKLGNAESDSGHSPEHPPDSTDSDVEVLVSESIFESQWSETDCSAIVLKFDQNPTDSMMSPCVSCRSDMSSKTNELIDVEYERLDKQQLIELVKQQSKDMEELNKKLETLQSAQKTLIGHFKVFRETVGDKDSV